MESSERKLKPGDLVRVEHESDFPVAVVEGTDELFGVKVRYLCDGLRTSSEQIAVKKGDRAMVDLSLIREVGSSETWWREQLEKGEA